MGAHTRHRVTWRRLYPRSSWTIYASSVLALLSFACSGGRAPMRNELSPGVVFPTSLGEGHGDDAPAELPLPSASAAPAPPPSANAPPPVGGPPDPEPLRLADQWEYELEWNRGALSVLAVRARRFPKPVVSARRFGRFAIELWIGNELVDRVRFDFPGLEPQPADMGSRKRLHAPPDFSKGAEVRQKVLVPAAPRARRAELIDRAAGRVIDLPWPPDHPLTPTAIASASAEPAQVAADASAAPAGSAPPAPTLAAPPTSPDKSPASEKRSP